MIRLVLVLPHWIFKTANLFLLPRPAPRKHESAPTPSDRAGWGLGAPKAAHCSEKKLGQT